MTKLSRPKQPPENRPYRSTLARKPEFVQAIGMVSVEMANLEIMLGELLGALLHIDRHFGRTIYLTPQANLARISIIENVLQDTLSDGSSGRKHIEALIKRARAVIGKRHEYIHNAWGLGAEDNTVVTRRSLPFKESHPGKPVSLSELTELIDRIRSLTSDVMNAADDAYANWPPYTWPQETPGRPKGEPNRSERPPKPTSPTRRRPTRSSRL